MRNYTALAEFLSDVASSIITLSFQQIDDLVGGLPPSARAHRPWWANSRTDDSHSWAHQWIAAGWECQTVDLTTESVTFTRVTRAEATAVAYWWVNHKQTFRAGLNGGYIWSPKKSTNGARNQTYDNLTLVKPGDLIVSYASGFIKALGVVTAGHQETAKPQEFGNTGTGWSDLGWMVPIDWVELAAPISPKNHLPDIRPLLPAKNSPLQANGNVNQGCYLAAISVQLGRLLFSRAAETNADQVRNLDDISASAIEDAVEREIGLNRDIPETEKIQLVRARRGQGVFRQRVMTIDNQCRLTGVDDQRFLIASHMKPWRDCTNEERLDGNNGLMLAPHADILFDRHLISFEDDGTLLVSGTAASLMTAWSLSGLVEGPPFSLGQRGYLEHHRRVFYKISDNE